MTAKARDYKRTTLRRLDTLSGNECAHPNCAKQLIASDGISIISKICHIEAANKKGSRYNEKMTDDERRHYNNLILLCDEHHVIIDNKENEALYPVSLLQEWKKNHESKQMDKLATNRSLLRLAINAIAAEEFEAPPNPNNYSVNPFDINDKISHNAIIRNAPLINEYKVYYAKIATLYDELELQGSFKKDKLLRNIRKLYLTIKGNYVGNSPHEMQLIRKHADDVIEDIENILLERVEKTSSNYIEDISFGISVIMVDAFMRCKILEAPNDL